MNTERTPATIGRTWSLITDPDEGKYPHQTAAREELERTLELAAVLWGADTAWESIGHSHFRMLLRRRLESLVADRRKGVRATHITVGQLITAVGWLRDKGHIPPHAVSWPRGWRQEVVQHWKSLTKSVHDPTPFRPKFTPEQARQILQAAAVFDPRLELLMHLGLDLVVARARRTDLDVRDGTLLLHDGRKRDRELLVLTTPQQAAVKKALGPDGYLGQVERMFLARELDDYQLFPAGHIVGRVGARRGQSVKLRLSDKVDYSVHVTSSWIRKNLHDAEKDAGIKHLTGRGALGLRRGIEEAVAPAHNARGAIFDSPTGWSKVDSQLQQAKSRLASGFTELDFQGVGFVCRETLISLAQEVYDSTRHPTLDGKVASDTDAGRMLEAFFAAELSGGSNEEARRHAKAALSLALALHHRRTADYRMAAFCLEATAGVTNLVAVLAGRRG